MQDNYAAETLTRTDNCRYQAIALTTWNGWVRILGGSRQSPDNPLRLNAGFAILRTADLGCREIRVCAA